MDQPHQAVFDFWTLLFCGVAFIGLFYSIKLLVTSRGSNKIPVLGVYLLLQSITLLEYVLHWTRLIVSFPFFSEISLLFPLLYGPLLVIYFNRSFGNDEPLMHYRYHFIPFVVALLFKMPFYVAPSNQKLFHTHEILFGSSFEYFPWVMLVHLSAYCIALVLLVRNQSGVGSMRLWAGWVVGFFICFVAMLWLYYSMAFLGVLSLQSDYFISLATSSTIFLIAWYGHGFEAVANGGRIFDSFRPVSAVPGVSSAHMIIQVPKEEAAGEEKISERITADKYRHSGLPRSLAKKLADDLERLMEREKLYHQNDLSLESLAEKLNSSKHFVSQVINQDFKVNFFEYVNLKRIEEARQLLRTTPRKELNIIEVAYAVGFNNKGTFNSVFKKVTGVTPTEFRRQSRQLLNPGDN